MSTITRMRRAGRLSSSRRKPGADDGDAGGAAARTAARARPVTRVAPQALRASWRSALDAADAALRAADNFLPPTELHELGRRLMSEREATRALLQAYAREEVGVALEHLALLPHEAQRLLGLPDDVRGCIFNLDGVLIGSAAIHAQAWSQTFEQFLTRRADRTGGTFAPFNPRTDYPEHIHGKPRLEGVRAFLASRGIRLAEGQPSDPPGSETVHGLANQKKAAFVSLLNRGGVRPFAGAQDYLETARDAHVRCAVVSASANARESLERAGLGRLVDAYIDGNVMVAQDLAPRPAPDIVLAACDMLGIRSSEAAVFETSPAGVTAARHAGSSLVVGVGRGDQGQALRDAGADMVVASLEELFDHRRAA